MFVQRRQQERGKDPETGTGECQSRWRSRGGLWRGTERGGETCSEDLSLFPPFSKPQSLHPTKDSRIVVPEQALGGSGLNFSIWKMGRGGLKVLCGIWAAPRHTRRLRDSGGHFLF